MRPPVFCGNSASQLTAVVMSPLKLWRLAEVALIEGGHTVDAVVGDLFGYINAVTTLYLWLILPQIKGSDSSE